MSYDPLSHSRHNAGDRSAKVGNEIKWCTGCYTYRRPVVIAGLEKPRFLKKKFLGILDF